MIENAIRNFSEMVWSRELIEHAIKNKKLEEMATPSKRTGPVKKNEGEAQAILTNQQHRGQAFYSN